MSIRIFSVLLSISVLFGCSATPTSTTPTGAGPTGGEAQARSGGENAAGEEPAVVVSVGFTKSSEGSDPRPILEYSMRETGFWGRRPDWVDFFRIEGSDNEKVWDGKPTGSFVDSEEFRTMVGSIGVGKKADSEGFARAVEHIAEVASESERAVRVYGVISFDEPLEKITARGEARLKSAATKVEKAGRGLASLCIVGVSGKDAGRVAEYFGKAEETSKEGGTRRRVELAKKVRVLTPLQALPESCFPQ